MRDKYCLRKTILCLQVIYFLLVFCVNLVLPLLLCIISPTCFTWKPPPPLLARHYFLPRPSTLLPWWLPSTLWPWWFVSNLLRSICFSSGPPFLVSLTGLGLIWWIVGPSCPSGWFHSMILSLWAFPSHKS